MIRGESVSGGRLFLLLFICIILFVRVAFACRICRMGGSVWLRSALWIGRGGCGFGLGVFTAFLLNFY
jgi:hypothetical protein